MTTLYNVKIAEFSTGTRIEGYSNYYYMFTDKEKALKFAYEKAVENSKRWYKTQQSQIKETVVFDPNGEYYEDGGGGYEDWPDYISTIEEIRLDLNSDMIGEVKFSDSEWYGQVGMMKKKKLEEMEMKKLEEEMSDDVVEEDLEEMYEEEVVEKDTYQRLLYFPPSSCLSRGRNEK